MIGPFGKEFVPRGGAFRMDRDGPVPPAYGVHSETFPPLTHRALGGGARTG